MKAGSQKLFTNNQRRRKIKHCYSKNGVERYIEEMIRTIADKVMKILNEIISNL
jgi:hypothetical protein